MKIYTRTGDKGTSSLFTGERRSKDDLVFNALGTIDELSSHIAIVIFHLEDKQNSEFDSQFICNQLRHIQCRLQALSSSVATPLLSKELESNVTEQRSARYAHVNFSPEIVINELESWIDDLTSKLPPLKQFILPSGGLAGSSLHLARTVCRRAERCVVALNSTSNNNVVEQSVLQYLNRLSDYLFTVARYVTYSLGYNELTYTVPHQSKTN